MDVRELRWIAPVFLGRKADDPFWIVVNRQPVGVDSPDPQSASVTGSLVRFDVAEVGETLFELPSQSATQHADTVDGVDQDCCTRLEYVALDDLDRHVLSSLIVCSHVRVPMIWTLPRREADTRCLLCLLATASSVSYARLEAGTANKEHGRVFKLLPTVSANRAPDSVYQPTQCLFHVSHCCR